jgi:nucleoid DNA-binding protein
MYELAQAVAAQTGLAPEQVQACVRVFLGEVANALARDGRVPLHPFGVFELCTHRGRQGRNPRTGEKVSIPARIRVRFRPGRALETMPDDLSQKLKKDDAGPGKPWWRFWK